MRAQQDIEDAVDRFGSTVWRACAVYFASSDEAQDAFQETFMKYALADHACFTGEEHRKAWLIRVATNTCKDMLKAAHRRNGSLDDLAASQDPASDDALSQPGSFSSDVLDALRSIDDPPRTPLYLSLYEGYAAQEIAKMLEAPVGTVYSWLSRGKEKLREALS